MVESSITEGMCSVPAGRREVLVVADDLSLDTIVGMRNIKPAVAWGVVEVHTQPVQLG